MISSVSTDQKTPPNSGSDEEEEVKQAEVKTEVKEKSVEDILFSVLRKRS